MNYTLLYKEDVYCGRFKDAQEIFDYIHDVERVEIRCLCQLEKLGYEAKTE